MTNLIRAALAFALCFAAFPAQADDTGPVDPQPVPGDHDPHPRLYGTFCSAAARDGVWGFVFNNQDVDTNCDYIESAIYSVTRARIYTSNSGYYLKQGWNEAVAQCGVIRSYFYERGAFALQRAYDYAQLIGGQHCIFEVYFRQ